MFSRFCSCVRVEISAKRLMDFMSVRLSIVETFAEGCHLAIYMVQDAEEYCQVCLDMPGDNSTACTLHDNSWHSRACG